MDLFKIFGNWLLVIIWLLVFGYWLLLPKLSDSPYFTREAETPQTLLECDAL